MIYDLDCHDWPPPPSAAVSIEVPREALADRSVALCYRRLLDELAVWRCWQDSLERLPALPSHGRRRMLNAAAVRTEGHRRILPALEHGPLHIEELIDVVHGPALVDAEEAQLRRGRLRQLMMRWVRRRLVVRVGRGWYALPHRTEGMRHYTRDDCRRLLATPKHRDGWTVAELVDKFDQLSASAIRKWIAELDRLGDPIKRTPPRQGRGYRYRIEPFAVRTTAAD